MMISIEDLPASIVGVLATGRVTKRDYETVLIPAVEAAFREHKQVSMLYQIGSDFEGFEPGAMLDDAIVGLRHLIQWRRIALVTDVEWIAHAAGAFAFLMPAKIKVFALAQAPEARAWVSQV